MGQEGNRLNDLQVRHLLRGFVQVRLGSSKYRIVGAEDFGPFWRVLVEYEKPSIGGVVHRHCFTINHQGRLVWEQAR